MVWALGCPCVHSGQGGMMIRQAWWGRDAPSCNFFSLVCSENIAPMPPASVSLMTEFWPIGSGSSMWVIFLKNTQYLPALPYIKKCWQCLFSMAWPKNKAHACCLCSSHKREWTTGEMKIRCVKPWKAKVQRFVSLETSYSETCVILELVDTMRSKTCKVPRVNGPCQALWGHWPRVSQVWRLWKHPPKQETEWKEWHILGEASCGSVWPQPNCVTDSVLTSGSSLPLLLNSGITGMHDYAWMNGCHGNLLESNG